MWNRQKNMMTLTHIHTSKRMHKTSDRNSKSILYLCWQHCARCCLCFGWPCFLSSLALGRCSYINKMHWIGKINRKIREMCNKTNSFCSATRVAVDTFGLLCRLQMELVGSFSHYTSSLFTFSSYSLESIEFQNRQHFIRNPMAWYETNVGTL